MFKAIKEFFLGKPAPVVDAVAPGGAPYKVEAPWTLPEPAATTSIPLVVEVAPTPIESIPLGIEAVIAAPTKKPRKPKAPKAPAVAPAAKQPAARSTTAKKPTSVSGTAKSNKT